MEEIDCVSGESVFRKNKTIEKLVLDKEKVGNKKIFRVANILEKVVIVDFDISESILRRGFWGVEFKHIETV